MSTRSWIVPALLVTGAARASAEPVDRDTEGGMMPTPLDVPESREASGTSWQPDSTPMFMWHAMSHGWSLGLHENAFVGYDSDRTSRGDDQLLSINWLMGMARHPVGDGDLTLRAMVSLEPLTLPGDGYPLLLQTGETWQGQPLHDRQHPHDLFMELAARVRQPLTDSLGLELYAAPAGEPAIGPPAFPHRFMAMADPLAPIGHHWQDATHISFGVLTAGLYTKMLKIEGSWFNGREPDENRWNLDLRAPDSFAARLTVNPSRDVSAQASWARLDSPEAMEPAVSIQRVTASVMWNHRSEPYQADLGVMALVGHNQPSSGPSTDAGLVEASLFHHGMHTLFTRAELATKTAQDLVLPDQMADRRFGMASLSAGFVYDFDQVEAIVPGLGVTAMLDIVGSDLVPYYGTRTPVGGMLFVRLRPPEMHMGGMAGMGGGHAMKGM